MAKEMTVSQWPSDKAVADALGGICTEEPVFTKCTDKTADTLGLTRTEEQSFPLSLSGEELAADAVRCTGQSADGSQQKWQNCDHKPFEQSQSDSKAIRTTSETSK